MWDEMWDELWRRAENNLTALLWQGDTAQASLSALSDGAEIQRWGEANLARLTPAQLATLIRRLPQARHRTIAIASLYPVAQSWDATAHISALQTAYGQSGWVLDCNSDTVDSDAVDSAATATGIVATIAIAILEAAGLAHERLRADRRLWETAPARENSTEPWFVQVIEQPDIVATLGIEVLQVAEFLAKQSRWLLNNPLVDVLLPLPLQVVAKGVQVATSDLVIDAAQVVEGNLELWRRRQTLEQPQLLIPTTEQVVKTTPAVCEAVEQHLRPLLARHLLSLARLYDPPLRNRQLDNLGRQFNSLNPWQYLQGWLQQQWFADWQAASPAAAYPEIASIQIYQQALANAAAVNNLMAQAEALRQAAQALEPTLTHRFSDD